MAKKRLKKPTKTVAKKAPKKAAKKKRPKKPARPVIEDAAAEVVESTAIEVVSSPLARSTYRVRMSEIRRLAAHDYITDPQQRSVDAWHAHPQRPYSEAVALGSFRNWSTEDGWAPRRLDFWAEIERRILEARKEELLAQKLKEIAERTEERDAMAEYLRPLRDEYTGEILRHGPTTTVLWTDKETGEIHEKEVANPLYGLPKLPLEMPSYEKLVTSFIKFDQHIMSMRGEPTNVKRIHHTDGSSSGEGGYHFEQLDDALGAEVAISDDDIQAMARILLRQREPELAAEFELEDDDE